MCAPEIRALTSIGGSLAKYGARGVDLANLVFEPSANRGFAIQIDFCRPSGARCARGLLSWLAGLGRRRSPIDSNQYWPARPGTHASAARPAVSGTARISRPPCSPALQLRNLRDPDPPATGSQPRCPQTEAWYAVTQSALALRYTGAVATSSVGGATVQLPCGNSPKSIAASGRRYLKQLLGPPPAMARKFRTSSPWVQPNPHVLRQLLQPRGVDEEDRDACDLVDRRLDARPGGIGAAKNFLDLASTVTE